MTRPADGGLQTERTRLSWRRTSLSASAAALLLLIGAIRLPSNPRAWVVLAAGTAWLALIVLTHHRITALTAGPRPAGRYPALLAVSVAALSLAGVALVFFGS